MTVHVIQVFCFLLFYSGRNNYFSQTDYDKMKGKKYMANIVLKRFKKIGRKFRINRAYKDQLFRLIFNNREDLLALYNAVNSTSYTNPDELIITTMSDAVYLGMKNDISFLIANVLNLYEHQSTLNPNMPASSPVSGDT